MKLRSFDKIAEAYDQWYSSPAGRAIFSAETLCLKRLGGTFVGRWVEIGVGTGRFAAILGIREGVDPSFQMLKMAVDRGVHVCVGRGEQLPFDSESFDGILMALSLCFIPNPDRALNECFRILKPTGNLLLGVVSAESNWGKLYAKKKMEGHPIYSLATFQSSSEIIALVEASGFNLQKAASTLFWKPDGQAEINPRVDEGFSSGAGFLGLLFTKNQIQR